MYCLCVFVCVSHSFFRTVRPPPSRPCSNWLACLPLRPPSACAGDGRPAQAERAPAAAPARHCLCGQRGATVGGTLPPCGAPALARRRWRWRQLRPSRHPGQRIDSTAPSLLLILVCLSCNNSYSSYRVVFYVLTEMFLCTQVLTSGSSRGSSASMVSGGRGRPVDDRRHYGAPHCVICCHWPSVASFHSVTALLPSDTDSTLPLTDQLRRHTGAPKSWSSTRSQPPAGRGAGGAEGERGRVSESADGRDEEAPCALGTL